MSQTYIPLADANRNAVLLSLTVEMVREFGEARFAAVGTSMLPALLPGDVVTVQREQGTNLVCGDIAVYLRNDRLFVHRVLRKQETGIGMEFIMRGDALPLEDPPVRERELVGVVAAITRGDMRIVPHRNRSRVAQAIAWTLCRSRSLSRLFLRCHKLCCGWRRCELITVM